MYYKIFQRFYQRAARKMCRDCQDFIKEDSKILDLGCGSGIVGKEFQNYFKAKLTGIDVEDRRIEKIPFQIFDGRNIPFSENSFDYVLISYVLHHAKNPVVLLKEAKRVGKRIIVFEDLPEGFLSKLRCTFHQASYNIFFQKKRQEFNFKTKKEWKELFKSLRLKIVAGKEIFTIRPDSIDPVKKILFVLEKTHNSKLLNEGG